jgi:uncharacterized protein HemX
MNTPKAARQVAEGTQRRSTGRLLLLLAVVVVLVMGVALFFEAR